MRGWSLANDEVAEEWATSWGASEYDLLWEQWYECEPEGARASGTPVP